MKLRLNVWLILLLAFFIFQPARAQEQNNESAGKPFNPNFIIDDWELTDYESMSVDSIRRFLGGKSGILSSYRTKDIDGLERDTSEIIWRAANSYRINPKFLIILLQREQSLVENPNPSPRDLDWATGYAVCDGCNTDDQAIQKFKGFAVQVDRAAWRQRYYLDHPDEFGVKRGEARLIDDTIVTPATQATANLYIYTPHLNGNRNFWIKWNEYFARNYPNGTLLQERGTENIWLLTNGELRLVTSKAALFSDYDAKKIVIVSTNDILRYDIGLPIKFSNYSLLRSPRGTVFLLVDDKRRGIASREIFRALGFNPEEVIDAGWEDINLYAEGVPITTADAKPLGELMQDKMTGGVYYVAYGVKHPIKSKEILRNRFARYSIKPVAPASLEKYYLGEPIKFKDAELVTAPHQPTVYVISNGQKRPIISAEVFKDLGYQWSNIIVTNPDALAAHPDGAPITG